jgi:uncharacterized protein (DUF1786 family)
MNTPDSILAVDVGRGTQDIFQWIDGQPIENSVQMVLPSQTVIVNKRIRKATSQGKGIYLTGNLMGGGPSAWAVRDHLKAGLPVHAAPLAAKTINDNLGRVESMGVQLEDEAAEDLMPIECRDIDLHAIKAALSRFGVELSGHYAVAVQDHGECPEGSNRVFRFVHWKRFLEDDGRLTNTGTFNPPPYMSRMRAIQTDAPGALVMDTAMAAIQGALCDPLVETRAEKGALIVNMGNQHVLAAMVQSGRVWGIFEHHTGAIDVSKLLYFIERFRKGALSNEEVFEDGGHGCYIHPERPKHPTWEFTAITGPMRHHGEIFGGYLAAPWGNMMLSGSFGLVRTYMESVGMKWEDKMGSL